MFHDSENLLKEINVVRDAHGHIIQQIFYHEQTGEYIMKEFTYSYENGKAVCIDQKTTIISSTTESDISTANSLTIYYNSELEIRPAVIMDNEYARITVKKFLSRDSWWEFGYDIEVLNKTNKVISIAFDNVYIMDISCQPLFSIDHIDAGKTANFLLGWDKETLERCYIPYIDNIEFMVRVFDNETWDSTALTGSRVLFKN
jgi:hypothetical protein